MSDEIESVIITVESNPTTIITTAQQGPEGRAGSDGEDGIDGEDGTGGSGGGSNPAAAILITPSLTPASGDVIQVVFYSPGTSERTGDAEAPDIWDQVTIPADWGQGNTYTFDEANDAGTGEHVLLFIDGEDGLSTWPTVYAEVTEVGFTPVELMGSAPVHISCGGAGFGSGSTWLGRNEEAGLGQTNENTAAAWFEPTAVTEAEVWTGYERTGNLEGMSSQKDINDWLDSYDFSEVADHTHPEYADFTYTIGFSGDGTLMGSTYNGDGTVTVPALANFPIEADLTLKLLFRGSPDSSFDGGYTYDYTYDPDDLGLNDWICTPYDQPFSDENIARIVSIGFDITANDSVLGLITFNGSDWSIRAASWDGHTHTGYSPVGHNHDGSYSALNHGHAGVYSPDVRETAQEYLRAEWDARTAPLLVTNPTPTVTNGGRTATWEITRATGRGTIPHTPGGLDIQWFGKVKRPWTDNEALDSGNTYSVWPYQCFYEILTLQRPSINNDWFEWARYMTDDNQPNGLGRATYFYENTPIGSPAEDPNNAVFDTGVEVGQPERARMTLDTATSTLTFWNWMPYDNSDPTLERCPRGFWWKPVFSDTNASWASMADPETELVPADHIEGLVEGDPETIVPWVIGIQGTMEIAELFMYEYGESTPLLVIDDACLTAAGVGSKSFVDSTTANTISTTDAYTIPGPAVDTYKPLSLGAWVVDTGTDDNPENGRIQFDASEVHISHVDFYGNHIENYLDILASNSWLLVQSREDPTQWARWITTSMGGGLLGYDVYHITADLDIGDSFSDGTLVDVFIVPDVTRVTHEATTVTVSASGFNGNLDTDDDDVQKVAQKVDDLVIGTGDVVGPTGASANRPALFDGTTGKLLKEAAGTLGTAAYEQADLFLIDASGFNGNLTSFDNTVQEVAQKLDDLETGGGYSPPASFFTVSSNKGYGIPGFIPTASAGTAAVSTNRLQFQPFVANQTINITKMAVEVTTAGAASSVMRVGIFEDLGNFVLGALVVDAGTLAMDPGAVPALQVATINETLPPGRYIGVHITNGSPTCRTYNGYVDGFPHMNGVASANSYAYSVYLSGQSATVAGGFGSIASGTAFDNVAFLNAGYNCTHIIRYQWTSV